MNLIIVSIDLIIGIFVMSSIFTYFIYFTSSGFNAGLGSLNKFSKILTLNAHTQNFILLAEDSGIDQKQATSLFASYNAVIIPFNPFNPFNGIQNNNSLNTDYFSRIISIQGNEYRLVVSNVN